jgi:hypothetical protein
MRAAFVAGLGVAGCGGGGDGGSGGGAFASEYSALVCDKLSDCCATAGIPIDAGRCRSLFQQKAAEAPEGLEFDQAAADACMSKLRASEGCAEVPECENVYRGTKQAGEACEDDEECARPEGGGEAECDRGFDAPGKCVHKVRGKAGDACAETCTAEGADGFVATSCSGFGEGGVVGRCFTNDGLFCSDETSKCEAMKAAGEACGGGVPCAAAHYCASGPDGGERTCAPSLAPGADCRDAPRDACGDGYCDDADGKCHAPKAAGEACDRGAFVEQCGRGAYCNEEGECEAESAGGAVTLACGLIAGGFGE